MHRKQRLEAFSLLELMVAIGLLAIITTLAIPSFGALMSSTRNYLQSQDILQSLNHARSLALAQMVDVVVCPAADETRAQCRAKTVRNTNWQYGWLVFSDLNRDGQYNNDDELHNVSELQANQKLVFNQVGRLRFFADGSARSAGFYLCDENGKAQRYIRLLHTGRARMSGALNNRQLDICSEA